jgi:hypothetical protein
MHEVQYVEVSFGGERMQTATKKSEYDPVYGESHEFTLSIDDHDDVPELKLSLYDWDRIKANEFIGCVVLTGREMHNIFERGPGAVVGDSHSLHNQDKKVGGYERRGSVAKSPALRADFSLWGVVFPPCFLLSPSLCCANFPHLTLHTPDEIRMSKLCRPRRQKSLPNVTLGPKS